MHKPNWVNGPASDVELQPGHGGPVNFIIQIMCLDFNQSIVVTGSTDHGLRVYDAYHNNKKHWQTIERAIY